MDTAVVPASTRLRWPLIAAAIGLGALAAATLALWVRYGTAVFHEIVTAGLALCF